MRRAIASCDCACDWSVERMAAFCGVSYSTFQLNKRVIVGRGLIVSTERRGTKHRNATNLWTLPQLATSTPLPKMADVLKLLKTDLKTNTPGSNEPVQSLPVRRKAKTRPAYSRSVENHPPEVRQRVERNARARHHRIERSHQHRPDASLGSRTPWKKAVAGAQKAWEMASREGKVFRNEIGMTEDEYQAACEVRARAAEVIRLTLSEEAGIKAQIADLMERRQ